MSLFYIQQDTNLHSPLFFRTFAPDNGGNTITAHYFGDGLPRVFTDIQAQGLFFLSAPYREPHPIYRLRCQKQQFMSFKTRRFILLFTLSVAFHLLSIARTSPASKKSMDWNPVMDAIIQVESEGNPKAVKGNSCGAMQITPIMVQDCNRILRKRGSSKRYTLADRFSISKSRAMFVLIQSYYNPDNDVEQAIRAWNGGQSYTRSGTQRYYEKVRRHLL